MINKKNTFFVLCVLTTLIFPFFLFSATNHAPVVSSVIVSQRSDSTRCVDIWYNVSDSDGDPLYVSIKASEDGGVTWNIYPKSVSGAVGAGVLSGSGKHIVWDIVEDYPNRQSSNFRVQVTAKDNRGVPPNMLYVPAGTFDMGDLFGGGGTDELPVHEVYLDAYFIDKYEVTNTEYVVYLNDETAAGHIEKKADGIVYQKGTSTPYFNDGSYSEISESNGFYTVQSGKGNFPVRYVSWWGAKAYAEFVGKRLPTEAQWEKAASWNPNNSDKSVYAWGDTIDQYWCNYNNYVGTTTQVGYYNGTSPRHDAKSWYGCYDMNGRGCVAIDNFTPD